MTNARIIRKLINKAVAYIGETATLVLGGVTYCNVKVVAKGHQTNEEDDKSRVQDNVRLFRFTLPCEATPPVYNDTVIFDGLTYSIVGQPTMQYNQYQVEAHLKKNITYGTDHIRGSK